VTFEDLIAQSRGQRAADEKDSVGAMDQARATLDAALGQTGWSAAMALASHGVRAVAVGQIKRRFGFDYPEQTSHAWELQRGLFLLRDGTWWHAASSTAPTETAPPPVIRWAVNGDAESPSSILELKGQLTGAVLQAADASCDDSPYGAFTFADDRGGEVAYRFWIVDGIAKIADGAAPGPAVPLDEWAAGRVAALIDARR
jgi:hypothetical protein